MWACLATLQGAVQLSGGPYHIVRGDKSGSSRDEGNQQSVPNRGAIRLRFVVILESLKGFVKTLTGFYDLAGDPAQPISQHTRKHTLTLLPSVPWFYYRPVPRRD